MTETKIYCDHCHKELDEMHDYVDIELDVGAEFLKTDLCKECLRELCRNINEFCGQPSKEVK